MFFEEIERLLLPWQQHLELFNQQPSKSKKDRKISSLGEVSSPQDTSFNGKSKFNRMARIRLIIVDNPTLESHKNINLLDRNNYVFI